MPWATDTLKLVGEPSRRAVNKTLIIFLGFGDTRLRGWNCGQRNHVTVIVFSFPQRLLPLNTMRCNLPVHHLAGTDLLVARYWYLVNSLLARHPGPGLYPTW